MKKQYIKLLIILLLFVLSCSNKSQSQVACFQIKSEPAFVIGSKFNLNKLSKGFGVNQSGDNFYLNNGLIDYASENNMKFEKGDDFIFGLLMFTLKDDTKKLVKLNAIWYFNGDDTESGRLNILKEIRKRYINCLYIEKFDLNKGSEYVFSDNGHVEKFTLSPRIKNGIDYNYWTLSYSMD